MSKKNTFDHHFGHTTIIRSKERLFALVKEIESELTRRRNGTRVQERCISFR